MEGEDTSQRRFSAASYIVPGHFIEASMRAIIQNPVFRDFEGIPTLEEKIANAEVVISKKPGVGSGFIDRAGPILVDEPSVPRQIEQVRPPQGV